MFFWSVFGQLSWFNGSVGKNPVDAHYFPLTKEIETNSQATKSKVGDSVTISKY